MTRRSREQERTTTSPPRLGTTVLVAHPAGGNGLQAELERAGFEVIIATSPEAAHQLACSGRASLAVIDARFEGDGLAFFRRLLTEIPGFPVILTGPDDVDLVTASLAAGADDYLALPLRPAELVARVRAVLRRVPGHVQPKDAGGSALAVGEVCLDPERFEVTVRGQRRALRLREFQLLRLLMENAGIVLTRATLLSSLWGPDAPLEGTTLEVHIRRLRSKVEDDPSKPRRILTVRGIGYKYQP